MSVWQPSAGPGAPAATSSSAASGAFPAWVPAWAVPILGGLSDGWSPDAPSFRLRVTVAGVVATLLVASVALVAGLSGNASTTTVIRHPANLTVASGSPSGPIQLPGLPPIDLSNLSSFLAGLTAPAPSPSPSPSPTPTPAASAAPADGVPASSIVADAMGSSVPIYGSPGGAVTTSIPGTNSIGQKEAFLIVAQQPGWYQVELPIKPDGSTGWIQSSAVTTRTDTYAIQVHQSQFRLDLYNNGQLMDTFPVAVGAPNTPTPNGSFFVWASQNWNHAPYAVGIFALSTFSAVLVNWPGGGRTGIHGWDDPSVLGKPASNGCVRMSGADFSVLLNTVPLGTPVQISQQ